MKKPVCRLNVALYGHPDSGTDWEHHCNTSLKVAQFNYVGGDCWPSCIYNKELDLLDSAQLASKESVAFGSRRIGSKHNTSVVF
jgi:hypothetical protein